jgi:hypothetical protein
VWSESRGFAFLAERLGQSGPLALFFLAYMALLVRPYHCAISSAADGGDLWRWMSRHVLTDAVASAALFVLCLEAAVLAHDFGQLMRVVELNLFVALAYLAWLRPRLDDISRRSTSTEYAAVLRARGGDGVVR